MRRSTLDALVGEACPGRRDGRGPAIRSLRMESCPGRLAAGSERLRAGSENEAAVGIPQPRGVENVDRVAGVSLGR
jgi:hypothetical protein